MFTESKRISDLHHAGIVLKGVDFVWPSTTDGDKRGELKYEIFRQLHKFIFVQFFFTGLCVSNTVM